MPKQKAIKVRNQPGFGYAWDCSLGFSGMAVGLPWEKNSA